MFSRIQFPIQVIVIHLSNHLFKLHQEELDAIIDAEIECLIKIRALQIVKSQQKAIEVILTKMLHGLSIYLPAALPCLRLEHAMWSGSVLHAVVSGFYKR